MPPLGFVFLVNRGNLARAKLYRAIVERLRKQPGCSDVRLQPSTARPRSVEANVDPTAFLAEAYPIDEATLTVRFSYPRSVDYEYYAIWWSEADRDLGLGWHRDGDHPDLGECHLQLDHADRTVDRRPASFLDEHPLEVLDARLDQLRTLLPELDWSGDEPALPSSDAAECRTDRS